MNLPFGECCIRSYEEVDVAALIKYANNRKIWLMLTHGFPHPYTQADAFAWIELVRHQKVETNFAIARGNELIGSIGFQLLEGIHCKTAEFGYWLGEPYWGQGIMTQAVPVMIDYIFRHHALNRIQAGVFASNPASARILEKSGFTLEGRLRQHVWKDENIQDLLRYAMLRDEGQRTHVKSNAKTYAEN